MKRMWWNWSLQLNASSFPASCIASKFDNTPASQAAVQWKRHFKVRVRKSKVTQSSLAFLGLKYQQKCQFKREVQFFDNKRARQGGYSLSWSLHCAFALWNEQNGNCTISAALDTQSVNRRRGLQRPPNSRLTVILAIWPLSLNPGCHPDLVVVLAPGFLPMLLIEGVMLFCTTAQDLTLVWVVIEHHAAIC